MSPISTRLLQFANMLCNVVDLEASIYGIVLRALQLPNINDRLVQLGAIIGGTYVRLKQELKKLLKSVTNLKSKFGTDLIALHPLKKLAIEPVIFDEFKTGTSVKD